MAAHLLPALARGEQRQRRVAAGQQALITADQDVGLGQNGSGHHPFIVGIHQAQPKGLPRAGRHRLFAQKGFDCLDPIRW